MNSGCIIWFTGLSGAGKTTLATECLRQLKSHHDRIITLDGDIMRTGLCKDLGFSDEDRNENLRRIAEVAKLFMAEGYIVLCAFITPLTAQRQMVRDLIPEGKFIEVFVDCSLQICEQRDPKGLYKKARKGEIKNFTGISMPYERPENPEIYIDNNEASVQSNFVKIFEFLKVKYLFN